MFIIGKNIYSCTIFFNVNMTDTDRYMPYFLIIGNINLRLVEHLSPSFFHSIATKTHVYPLKFGTIQFETSSLALLPNKLYLIDNQKC